MIEIRNLSKSFGLNRALSEFSITINEGSVYGIVGPNGAGKTTLFKIIAGLLKADSGEILIDGKIIDEKSRSSIGYMPDFFGVYDKLKVREYMEFYKDIYGIDKKSFNEKLDSLLEMVHLEDQKENYVESLSRGMKQKLCLARCLLSEPKLLVMDEPASGLDPRSRYEFRQIVRRLHDKGNTILISSHILSDLSEICSDICIIDNGRTMLSGSLQDIENSMSMAGIISIRVNSKRELLLDMLRDEKLVDSISYSDGIVRINYSGSREDAAALLKKIIEHDIPVYSFSIDSDNLEALFMKITA